MPTTSLSPAYQAYELELERLFLEKQAVFPGLAPLSAFLGNTKGAIAQTAKEVTGIVPAVKQVATEYHGANTMSPAGMFGAGLRNEYVPNPTRAVQNLQSKALGALTAVSNIPGMSQVINSMQSGASPAVAGFNFAGDSLGQAGIEVLQSALADAGSDFLTKNTRFRGLGQFVPQAWGTYVTNV